MITQIWKKYENLLVEWLTDGELIMVDDFFKNSNIKNSPALQKHVNGIDPLYEDEDFLNRVV
jgi:hypothetical protein